MHKARKRFGQNFLHDPGVIDRIVRAIHPSEKDNIVEIGPGQGALSFPLLTLCQHITLIELDRDLVPILERNLSPAGQFSMHNEDALKFDFSTLKTDERKMRIVGNLPYNISTPLLFHLVDYAEDIKDMYFMLQKEVVDRICAEPNTKSYGRLSVMLQYHCAVEKLFNVGPGAFNPAPKVESSIVRLLPLATKGANVNDLLMFSNVVSQCFNMRRKTIRNSLKTKLTEQQIESVGIDPVLRPENLTLQQFADLSNLASVIAGSGSA